MIRVGSLHLVKPVEKFHPGWTVLWSTPDATDMRSQSIHEDCVVLVLEVQSPYVKVIAPQGQGWLSSKEIKEIA